LVKRNWSWFGLVWSCYSSSFSRLKEQDGAAKYTVYGIPDM
jgi:hypothetical protein